MKVVFVTRGYPSKEDPMLGNYEAVQAKALAKQGVNVAIFCIRNVTDAEKENIETISEDGIKVYRYHKRYPWGAKTFLRVFYNRFFEVALCELYKRYVEECGNADIIHAHIVSYASYCKLLVRREKIPLVITEHWSRINYPILKDPRLLYWQKTYSMASRIIAVSSFLAKSLKRKFNVDSIVIGNMVEDRFFNAVKMEGKDGMFQFVAVGNLIPRKGFDLLIKAFARCRFDCHVFLKIVGGGVELNRLKKLAKEYGVQDQVDLVGVKTPEEVGAILQQSDSYVLSSHVETFGIVLIEAMAKGLPVIATACQGPEDFVNEENGILIPVNNVDALAAALKKMYNSKSKYDMHRIRESCYESYSEHAIACKILNIYKSVLN